MPPDLPQTLACSPANIRTIYTWTVASLAALLRCPSVLWSLVRLTEAGRSDLQRAALSMHVDQAQRAGGSQDEQQSKRVMGIA
jgi:hypothetical protein